MNFEIGASASTSSGSNASQGNFGDFVFDTGGTKSNITLYVVLGLAALLVVILVIFKRK